MQIDYAQINKWLIYKLIKEYNIIFAPVAQLDRVLGFEPRGREFESSRAHHLLYKTDMINHI